MKGSMSTDLGIITVNPEVIAKYAGSVVFRNCRNGGCKYEGRTCASSEKR